MPTVSRAYKVEIYETREKKIVEFFSSESIEKRLKKKKKKKHRPSAFNVAAAPRIRQGRSDFWTNWGALRADLNTRIGGKHSVVGWWRTRARGGRLCAHYLLLLSLSIVKTYMYIYYRVENDVRIDHELALYCSKIKKKKYYRNASGRCSMLFFIRSVGRKRTRVIRLLSRTYCFFFFQKFFSTHTRQFVKICFVSFKDLNTIRPFARVTFYLATNYLRSDKSKKRRYTVPNVH